MKLIEPIQGFDDYHVLCRLPYIVTSGGEDTLSVVIINTLVSIRKSKKLKNHRGSQLCPAPHSCAVSAMAMFEVDSKDLPEYLVISSRLEADVVPTDMEPLEANSLKSKSRSDGVSLLPVVDVAAIALSRVLPKLHVTYGRG